MIVWCSYCQRFIGERPPYDDLSMTHGICRTCVVDGELPEYVPDGIRAIASFFQDFLRRAVHGPPPDSGQVIDAGRRLGVQPVDLLLGIAQPTLYTIGRYFAAGRVSVEREHKLSVRVDEILLAFEGPSSQPEGAPRLLLGRAPGNRHELGLRMFALALAEHGVAVDLVADTDAATVRAALARQRYDCVGFSAALPGQLDEALEGARVAKIEQPGVLTALGGFVTKDQLSEAGEFDLVADPRSSRETAARLAAMMRDARADERRS